MKKITTLAFASLISLAFLHAQTDWHITGNAGTTPGTNFLGTTDAKAFMIKVNNQKSGYIDYLLTNASNTSFGYQTLLNISGSSSGANSAFGYQSLFTNSSGSYNSAFGQLSMYSNTSGYSNTAVGQRAMYSNTGGYYNTACGVRALHSNTTGAVNTAIGHQALYNTTIGGANTASGYKAAWFNTSGFRNTGSGYSALYSNTTGYDNTAVGADALFHNISGNHNTALGHEAGVLYPLGALVNATAIGAEAVVDASNKVRIGNSSVTSIGGQVGWSTFSDGRYKRNVKQDVKGLDFINSLQPVTYTVNVNGLNEYYNQGVKHTALDGKTKNELEVSANEAARIVYNGFIAQDVEVAARKLNYNFSGVDKPTTKDGLYGLRYADFVVPLVKAVQELDANEKDAIAALQKENNELKERLAKLEAIMNRFSGYQQKQLTVNGQPSTALEQNIPNPFSNSTTINYNLPSNYTSAKIIVTDKRGSTLKQINLSGNGKGTVHVDASSLASGAYQYSLYVNDKLIDTKQMVLSK